MSALEARSEPDRGRRLVVLGLALAAWGLVAGGFLAVVGPWTVAVVQLLALPAGAWLAWAGTHRASFRGVERIAVSPAGEVFVWDLGNASIRKIAADADHTVSTLVTGIEGNVQGLVFLDDKLYLWGNGSDLYLTEVDPGDGTTRDVLHGRGELFGWDSTSPLYLGGIVTDGVRLVVYYNGQLFEVSRDGDIGVLAGDGTTFEFSPGYDPYADHPAAELQLPSRSQVITGGANLWMGIDADSAVYVNTRVASSYIERVTCGRQ